MYLQIVVSINGNELHRYSFSEGEILIGRSSDCDVILDNAGVSRTHAKIVRVGERVQLVDLNSGNGTFLNGKGINEAFVTPDDFIGIGKFNVTAKLAAEALPDSEAHPQVDAEPVKTNTVFLRPEETRKILEKTQVAPKPAATAPVRPAQPEAKQSSGGLLFIAGALVGLLCGWLIWG
jgi:FOG: FHA domain